MARTIGIAIGVPEPWGSELDGYRAAAGDPMAALIPAHVTLIGPVEVPASAELDSALDERLAQVAASHDPFTIELRGTGTFRPVTQVVFVAVAKGISECERLAGELRSSPLHRPLTHPYHPHVTVAHDLSAMALDEVYAQLAGYTASFEVDHFTRYEHGGDEQWRPVRQFPFGKGSQT